MTDPRIQRAREIIETRYAERILVADLADAAHLSRFEFMRRFKAEVGIGPYDYLIGMRMAQARTLLRETELPIREVGARVGMPDPTAFGRAFRRRVGMCPRDYRRKT